MKKNSRIVLLAIFIFSSYVGYCMSAEQPLRDRVRRLPVPDNEDTYAADNKTMCEYVMVNFGKSDIFTLSEMILNEQNMESERAHAVAIFGMLGDKLPTFRKQMADILMKVSVREEGKPEVSASMGVLLCAYGALGRIGSNEAIEFLKERASDRFWKEDTRKDKSQSGVKNLAILGLAYTGNMKLVQDSIEKLECQDKKALLRAAQNAMEKEKVAKTVRSRFVE